MEIGTDATRAILPGDCNSGEQAQQTQAGACKLPDPARKVSDTGNSRRRSKGGRCQWEGKPEGVETRRRPGRGKQPERPGKRQPGQTKWTRVQNTAHGTSIELQGFKLKATEHRPLDSEQTAATAKVHRPGPAQCRRPGAASGTLPLGGFYGPCGGLRAKSDLLYIGRLLSQMKLASKKNLKEALGAQRDTGQLASGGMCHDVTALA